MTDTSATPTTTPSDPEIPFHTRIWVNGATGFVGRHVVRELIARGHTAVCLVRDREEFLKGVRDLPSDKIVVVVGDLFDADALTASATNADAAIHLVGIISENRVRHQTFERIHVEGTRRVVEACESAGVKRYVHMSALGTRRDAASQYHRTKWRAEGLVRESNLDWTIFRPSIIHGPDGEFMRMMKTFVCNLTVPIFGFLPVPFPVIPYFGTGENKLQPVSVRDVAHCFVAAISNPATIKQTYNLGGPEAVNWKELYRICRDTIPCGCKCKPIVGQPVWAAKLMAMTLMKLPILPGALRFNTGQVDMSQEDSICDIVPVEKTFGFKLRDFRQDFKAYAAQIQ